jgi:phage/plasmid primase-like uncharacterized protein
MSAPDLLTVAVSLGATLRRVGSEFIGPCPRCGGVDRFGISVTKALWHCRHCQKGGDVIDLLRHVEGIGYVAAVERLTGEKPAPSRPLRRPVLKTIHNNNNMGIAQRIWRDAVGIVGSPGEAYLAARGIVLDDVPNAGGLRFDPRTSCIIGRYTDATTAEPRGIWRRPINGGKPKALGPMKGCVVRLWPDEAVEQGLVLGEGVETTLAAATRIEHRATLLRPAWAAGSADNIQNFPVLDDGVEALTILADHDANGIGQAAAERCATRWAAAGREVILLTPNDVGDFNDLVQP